MRIESSLDQALQQGLISRGHKLTPVNSMGVSQAIQFDRATGQFLGVYDPRVPGKAAGHNLGVGVSSANGCQRALKTGQ